MATCADAPDIDVTFLDYPDPAMGEYGARGVGEIRAGGRCAGDHGSCVPCNRRAGSRTAGVRDRESA